MKGPFYTCEKEWELTKYAVVPACTECAFYSGEFEDCTLTDCPFFFRTESEGDELIPLEPIREEDA